MKLTIAFLSILLVANPSVTAEKRRNLDEEEERYDGPHSVDRLKMDHDYLSKPQCDQDTFEVKKKQMNRGDYITLVGNIQDSGLTNTYIVVKDRDLNVSFQTICEDSGGHMVSADVSYEANQDSEACNNGLINYSSYPICLAKSCEEGSKTKGSSTQSSYQNDYSEPEPLLPSDNNACEEGSKTKGSSTQSSYQNDYSEPEPLLPSDNNASAPCLSDEGNVASTCLASEVYYYQHQFEGNCRWGG